MNHPCVVWPMAVPLPKVTVTNPYTATAYHTRPCPRRSLHHQLQLVRRTSGKGICRAGSGSGSELTQDAPFAIAIGACFLNSLLFPLTAAPSEDEDEDEDEAAPIGPTDARFAVMTIMAFIPFFNWLSWVFALMDTGKRRYAVYAAVYLAPYLRTNFSLSPEESWLPIASIVLCIVHIQLEASIRSGDLDAFAFFNEAAERFGLFAGSKDDHSGTQGKVNKGRKLDSMELPSGQTQWEDHIQPSREAKHVSEDSDLDDGTEH